jgi:RNA polymerase sigma factor (sigma-70 family)
VHKTYIKNEKQRIVMTELNLLPEKDRNLLILYKQELSYNEIAQILDMNVTSVGTTLARAIEKFSENLKKKHHELFE